MPTVPLKDGINKLAMHCSDIATSLKTCHSNFIWRWFQICWVFLDNSVVIGRWPTWYYLSCLWCKVC